jgi:N-acetylmuramoyl-L-alanine amidase
MKKINSWLSIIILGFACIVNAKTSIVENISLTQNGQFQLLFTLSEPVKYKAFLLKNPERIVVDLEDARNQVKLSATLFASTPITQSRVASKAKTNLRYVFELNAPVVLRKQQLLKTNQAYQLSIPFMFKKALVRAGKSVVIASTLSSLKLPEPVLPMLPHKSAQNLRTINIVLDPGHGGKDPGTSGPLGTYEKDVTLAIALKLRDALQTLPGVKVYMTRTTDIYPSLGTRLSLARRVNTDIYISIHADAYHNRAAQGVTIFALSQGRATSEAAHWIAERENKSELLGGINLTDKGYLLRSVLVDLSQTATIGSSLKLGSSILKYVRSVATLHSRKVEQASLYVLTSPDIPAILIETGFLSNRNEEKLLSSSSYQNKLAQSIKQGIGLYLIQNPIPNTLFNAKIFTDQYIGKPGDTITAIAKKFQISAADIQKANNLSQDKVAMGQIIRIPSPAVMQSVTTS